MIWTNENNDKFIYMLNLDILGHLDTFYVDKYLGVNFILKKTNTVTTVSVDTIESIAAITTNKKGLYYLPNIDVQYTNELTKQFAFISKSITHKSKKGLITNDKQLMMKIIKKIIKKKITTIEQLRKATIRQNPRLTSNIIYTYICLYDNTIEKLYEIYNTLNEKIKSL